MSNQKSLIIAVDFDGTCVFHDYPHIGQEIAMCSTTLKALQKAGHRLILYTMRSGATLDAAVKWMADRGFELWGINENPEQHTWSDSRKVYAHIYIDDAALGCPLIDNPEAHSRPFVNWATIFTKFRNEGIIPSLPLPTVSV